MGQIIQKSVKLKQKKFNYLAVTDDGLSNQQNSEWE